MTPIAGVVPGMIFLLKRIYPAPGIWYKSSELMKSFFFLYSDEQRTSKAISLHLVGQL